MSTVDPGRNPEPENTAVPPLDMTTVEPVTVPVTLDAVMVNDTEPFVTVTL